MADAQQINLSYIEQLKRLSNDKKAEIFIKNGTLFDKNKVTFYTVYDYIFEIGVGIAFAKNEDGSFKYPAITALDARDKVHFATKIVNKHFELTDRYSHPINIEAMVATFDRLINDNWNIIKKEIAERGDENRTTTTYNQLSSAIVSLVSGIDYSAN